MTARIGGGIPDHESLRSSGKLVLLSEISSKNFSCFTISLSLPAKKYEV